MKYRIFSQAPGGRLDLAQLLTNARRFFEASVEVLEQHGLVPGVGPEPVERWARVRLVSERRGVSGVFRIRCRAADVQDWEDARAAEARGHATGMGALAARCETVWDVEPEGDAPEAAALNLCALLASVALGPVLPPDASTLFGIRGAMERLDALTTRSLAR